MSNNNLNLKSQFATSEKWDSLRSQNVTIEGRRGQHRKYLPHAFTEQGGCTIPMHTCKGVHKKAIELCIGTEGMYRYCACFTGGAQNNSFEFDGFGKYLYFNYGEFTTIKSQVVLNRFTLTPKQWIEISQQDVGQFAQITWDHNSLIIPKCGNLKKVKVV